MTTQHYVVRWVDGDIHADHFTVFHDADKATEYAADQGPDNFTLFAEVIPMTFSCVTKPVETEGPGGMTVFTDATVIRFRDEFHPIERCDGTGW